MLVQLLLIGLSLLIRTLGSIGRSAEKRPFLHFFGWLLAGFSAWLGVTAAGGWPPLWSLGLVITLPILSLWNDKPFSKVTVLTDGLIAFTAGFFGLPPLDLGPLLIVLLLIPSIGFLFDWLFWQLQKNVPLFALGGLVGAGLLLIFLLPQTSGAVLRVLDSRFAYLMPQPFVEMQPTLTPRPTASLPPTAQATAVAVTSTAEPTNTPAPIITVESQGNRFPAVTLPQWSPYAEWHLTNESYSGNPFDLTASATFIHEQSGKTVTTGLFYDDEDIWRFRFTGSEPGDWSFTTQSSDPDLNDYQGEITVVANPGQIGFVTNYDEKWGRTGVDEAFVPQFVMIGNPQTFYNNPAEIEYNIQTFMVDHGFNGVHTPVFCRWFMLEKQKCSAINSADPNPDIRTFQALEALITEVHAAGGVVHIWMWGDDTRSENPKRWGINDTADLRLQRYIAARLGPIPGWTMGYGYDLFEWVTPDELDTWYTHMISQLGWPHYLGARSNTNSLGQLSELMSYASYEQHKPTYDHYVRTIDQRPNKPSFSEDRFRIRDEGRPKDYTMEETRRGLWHATMAGGIANIWGNLLTAPQANNSIITSAPYPNPEMIKTYALFWQDRFFADMERCNERTDGVCLMSPSEGIFVFYKEDAASITIDLSDTPGGTAVAIDTKLAYEMIDLGPLASSSQNWDAPYLSDWAIAVVSQP